MLWFLSFHCVEYQNINLIKISNYEIYRGQMCYYTKKGQMSVINSLNGFVKIKY